MNRETATIKMSDTNIVDEKLKAEYLNRLKKPYVKKVSINVFMISLWICKIFNTV